MQLLLVLKLPKCGCGALCYSGRAGGSCLAPVVQLCCPCSEWPCKQPAGSVDLFDVNISLNLITCMPGDRNLQGRNTCCKLLWAC